MIGTLALTFGVTLAVWILSTMWIGSTVKKNMGEDFPDRYVGYIMITALIPAIAFGAIVLGVNL